MNKRQIAKYGMFHLVLSFCTRYIDTIKTIPAFAYAFNTFEGLVRAIDNTAPKAARKTTGPAAAKKQLRESLQDQTLTISLLIYAYASEKDDLALKEKVSYTKRELASLSGEELAPVCKVILQTGRELLPEMGDYKLTKTQLDNLEMTIGVFMNSMPMPQLEINDSRSASVKILTLFAEAEKVLDEKMDGIAFSIKDAEPEFYTGYDNSRKITDPATRHTKVSGTVNDKSTGMALDGVTVKHEVTGLKAMTNAAGEFQLEIPLTGDNPLTVKKAGYKTTQVMVTLKRGQNSQVVWELEPSA